MITKPRISLIVALDEKRGIGRNNKLLFKIVKDLKRFKQITLGQSIIMGRKTFDSIGKPLPKRINIVVTRNKNYQAQGCFVFNSLKKAIAFTKTKDNKEIFIIGGGQIYRQSINLADKLYLTLIKGDYKADTLFPDYSSFKKVVYDSGWQKENGFEFKFLELTKV